MHHGNPKPGTLAALAESGVAIYIVCMACQHRRLLKPLDVIHKAGNGWGTTIAELERRHRCSQCGKRKAKLRRG